MLVVSSGAVCLAQFNADPKPSNTVATLAEMSGQVSVLRGASAWAMNVGDTIAPQQVITTGPDGWGVFTVNDGSTFEVFPNSRVVFRTNYNPQDLLDVILGRIKVHIQKWSGRPNNNRIHTPSAVISVRGTTFDVVVDAEESTVVAVEEGQVEVRHRLLPTDRGKILNGGDEIRVYRNEPLAKSRIDRGTIAKRGMDALAEAFYTIIFRSPRGGGASPLPGGGAGGGAPAPLPGDTESGDPPPPPPPPPGP